MQGRPLRLCLWLRREREALDRQSYGLQRECHCVKVLEGDLGQATKQSAAKCCFDWAHGIGLTLKLLALLAFCHNRVCPK